MFTSPSGGEGTTTVIAAYARVLAVVSNAAVAVVDARLDAPALHTRFGLRMAPGLRDWKAEDPDSAITVLPDDPRVHVLTAGSANDTTLYSLHRSGLLATLSAHLRQRFAWVLWDAPPMNPNPEARFLSGHVDGILAVLEADATRLEALAELNDTIARCGAHLLGSILNRHGRYVIGPRSPSRALRLSGP